MSQLKSTQSLTTLAAYSARLFEELEDETGQATGYRGLFVGYDNEQRWEEIRRGATMADGSASNAEDLDHEAAERFPHMRTDDLVGALYIPRRPDLAGRHHDGSHGAPRPGATVAERRRHPTEDQGRQDRRCRHRAG